eukprot:TRINITY_DN15106_c0_g1_i1.p1 TRINITY_DN15106_c0_g1~~TRINITY_DN15106_c0_g1_i1.p1  ORF type:complete len:289 (+),score=32.19 TRINITY_DN15106_c0_g1_i1:23-889(+)
MFQTLVQKLEAFEAKVYAFLPVPVECPLSLSLCVRGGRPFFSLCIDTLEVQADQREKLLNPAGLSESEEGDGSEDKDGEESGEEVEKEKLVALEGLSEIAKVQRQVGLLKYEGGVYLWSLDEKGSVGRVSHDPKGKFTGAGSQYSKILAQVYALTESLPSFLLQAKEGRRLPHVEWSAYAPFWSGMYSRRASADLLSPRFQSLVCYGSSIEKDGHRGNLMLLVDPRSEGEEPLPRGVVIKFDGEEGMVVVLVFKDFANHTHQPDPNKLNDQFLIDPTPLQHRRVHYIK